MTTLRGLSLAMVTICCLAGASCTVTPKIQSPPKSPTSTPTEPLPTPTAPRHDAGYEWSGQFSASQAVDFFGQPNAAIVDGVYLRMDWQLTDPVSLPVLSADANAGSPGKSRPNTLTLPAGTRITLWFDGEGYVEKWDIKK